MSITPAAWLEGGQYLEWRGLQLFYRVAGPEDGEPLLLLHGFPTSSWDWQQLWPELTKRYRVIAFDYGGFGFSSKPRGGPYSVLAYADQAEAISSKLGIKAAHLLAHDLGDSVAQELMARGNEVLELKSVCLLNGGIFPEMHRPLLTQKLLNSPLGFLVAKLIKRDSFEKTFASIFGPNTKPSQEELQGFWALVSRDGGLGNYHRLIRYIRERKLHRDRWVSPILKPACPFLFIDGLADPISGDHVVQRFRELNPAVNIIELPEIGHYPQTEAPERVIAAYDAFRAR
jgi:pimeloyl-ACP methyl ester carboxylesterase